MTRQAKTRPFNWRGKKQPDGTWIATCEALDITVQLTSDSLEEQMQEVVEVMQMIVESLNEKGILFDYFQEHGIDFTEVQSPRKGEAPVQVFPLPINFSQEPSLAPVGA